ncbi:DUF4921 family protein [Kolteria novifilia]|uniref:galactose-1-phosphate uridylyltransferase n=1 Tax=Kolteria novifilia TaxID=2527975 RepID=UPI003AF35D56
MKPTDDRSHPEYRRDPLTGQIVIIARQRAHRPMSRFPSDDEDLPSGDCPFCEGRETMTPPEVFAIRPEGGARDSVGWQVRVVPNKYPALMVGAGETPSWSEHSGHLGDLLQDDALPGVGHHEVVIECPDHASSYHRHGDAQAGAVFLAYRERLRCFARKEGIASAIVFKNSGRSAGASQPHAHSQIIAMPLVPPILEREWRGCDDYWRENGRHYFANLLDAERSHGERIVEATDDFVAWCPYASRFPYELCVCPREEQARYDEASDHQVEALGALMRRLMLAMDNALGSVAFNYFLHTASLDSPNVDGVPAGFRWHLEITPRLEGLAGFEIGSGMYINPVPPDMAARDWRRYMPAADGATS